MGGTNLYYSPLGWESTGQRVKIGGYGWDDHHPDQHEILFFPDVFLPHGKPEEQYEEANLLSKDIAYCALQTLGSNYSKKEIDLV